MKDWIKLCYIAHCRHEYKFSRCAKKRWWEEYAAVNKIIIDASKHNNSIYMFNSKYIIKEIRKYTRSIK